MKTKTKLLASFLMLGCACFASSDDLDFTRYGIYTDSPKKLDVGKVMINTKNSLSTYYGELVNVPETWDGNGSPICSNPTGKNKYLAYSYHSFPKNGITLNFPLKDITLLSFENMSCLFEKAYEGGETCNGLTRLYYKNERVEPPYGDNGIYYKVFLHYNSSPILEGYFVGNGYIGFSKNFIATNSLSDYSEMLIVFYWGDAIDTLVLKGEPISPPVIKSQALYMDNNPIGAKVDMPSDREISLLGCKFNKLELEFTENIDASISTVTIINAENDSCIIFPTQSAANKLFAQIPTNFSLSFPSTVKVKESFAVLPYTIIAPKSGNIIYHLGYPMITPAGVNANPGEIGIKINPISWDSVFPYNFNTKSDFYIVPYGNSILLKQFYGKCLVNRDMVFPWIGNYSSQSAANGGVFGVQSEDGLPKNFTAKLSPTAGNTGIQTTLNINAPKEGQANIRVVDMNGKVVQTKRFDLFTGNNNIDITSMRPKRAGGYIIQIIYSNETQETLRGVVL